MLEGAAFILLGSISLGTFGLAFAKKKKKSMKRIFLFFMISITLLGGFAGYASAVEPAEITDLWFTGSDFSPLKISHERGSNVVHYSIPLGGELDNGDSYLGMYYISLDYIGDVELDSTNIMGTYVYNNSLTTNQYYFSDSEFAECLAYGASNTKQGYFKANAWSLMLPNAWSGSQFNGQLLKYDEISGNFNWASQNSSVAGSDTFSDLWLSGSNQINLNYHLEPTIALDSEYYNFVNTRVEIYDNWTQIWQEQAFDNIVLTSPSYKIRIYDIESNQLIYQDLNWIIFQTHRNIELDSIKLVNNAGEPVIFHISNSTTTYANTTYYNSLDLVDMIAGTKNSTDYSSLDYGGFIDLLIDPYSLEDWYPDNHAMINGTTSGAYSDMYAIDTDFYSFYPNQATTWVDWVWSYENSNPTNSAYVDGSSSSPYSNMEEDDTDYYSINSDYDSEQTDYEWSFEDWVAVNSAYVNGSTSNPYSYLETDDDDFYTVASDYDSYLSDYEWSYENDWNPDASSYINGSSSDPYSNMNADDTSYYTIESDYEEGDSGYPLYNYTETADSISMTDGNYAGALTNYDSNDGQYVQFTEDSTPVYSTPNWDGYKAGTGAGTYTAWTNTYTSWDETWYSDADYISATVAVDQTKDESMAMANSGITGTYRLNQVQVELRYYVSDWTDVYISAYIYIDGTWSSSKSLGIATSWATSSTLTWTYGGSYTVSDFDACQVRVRATGDHLGSGGTGYVSCARARISYSYIESYDYDLDGYTEFDYTELYTSGNISDRDDITDIGLNYRSFTSPGYSTYETYAYNFDTSQWVFLEEFTRTIELQYSNYSISNSFIKNDMAELIFRLRIFLTSGSDDCYFDVLTLEVEYQNQNEFTTNYYHEIEGYLEIDLSDLYTNGNITSRDDIESLRITWLWMTNISNSVDWYYYDWTATDWDFDGSDTQTSFGTDYIILSSEHIDPTNYLIRLKFESTLDNLEISGISLIFDWVYVSLWYENQHLPTYDFYHEINGYLEFDLSDIYSNGNITSRDDFMDSTFYYLWKTNISNSVDFSMYNFDTTQWDLMAIDTQTSFILDTNTTVLDEVKYIDPTNYYIRFKFETSLFQENETSPEGIQIEFDLVKLSIAYENQYLPTYNFTHTIDGYLEFDLSDLYNNGNITSKADFMETSFYYLWKTNISNQVDFYVYNWDTVDWDIVDSDTQTSFILDTNLTVFDDTTYIHSSTYLARFKFYSTLFQENETDPSGIQLEFDYVNLVYAYENHHSPTYDWYYYTDGYVEWDLSNLDTLGNITCRADIINSLLAYNWKTNISNSVTFYIFNWTVNDWDSLGSDTQTAFATDTFDINQEWEYIKNEEYLIRLRAVTEYIDDNKTIGDGGVLLAWELGQLNVTYHNQYLIPTWEDDNADSLKLTAEGAPAGGASATDENFYPDNHDVSNGTVPDPTYSYLSLDDTNYFTYYQNTETTSVDFVWSFETMYASNSAYTHGFCSDPYSATYSEDAQYYSVLSTSQKSVSDYIWALEHLYPTDGYHVNGSYTNLYEYMDDDDLDYFISIANSESMLNGDFEWAVEQWYADNSAFVNGTSTGSYSDMYVDDTSYFTAHSNSEGIPTGGGYGISSEEWYAINSAYINGTGNNPYSYMELDDTNYYYAVANTESSQVDYVWWNDDWYPMNSAYTNGSSGDPYSDMETDDTNYYIITCNSDGVEVDYVWFNGLWYPTGSSFTNGSSSDPYTDLESDDTDYWTVEPNTESSQTDYEWSNGDYFPTDSIYENGTTSGPYSNMNIDDTNYYIISSNEEHGAAVDYVWWNSDWYPTSSSFINGSSSSSYAFLNIIDAQYYIIEPNTESTISDYEWMYGDWYPDNAAFVNGSTASPYSYLDTDDEDFYTIVSDAETTLNGDYVWSFEDFYPDNALYINGTGNNPYSYMEVDDTNYYYITSNSEGTQIDYVWMFNAWYPVASAYVNGSSSDPYSNMNIDDTNYYTIACNSESTIAEAYTNVQDTFYATSSSITLGSGTGTIPDDINADDTNYYYVDCDTNPTFSHYLSDTHSGTPASVVETNGTYSGLMSYLDSDDGDNVEFICNSEYSGGGGTEYFTEQIRADSDSASAWTAGTYADIIDDSDATEINTKSASAIDEFTTKNPIASSGIIDNITIVARSQMESAGSADGFRIGVRVSGGTLNYGDDYLPTATWANYTFTWDTNPEDSQAWEWADIIGLYHGVQYYKSGGAKTCSISDIEIYVNYQDTGSGGSEFHELDEYVVFDYSILGSSGDITARTDITGVQIDWRFYSNVSQSISVYAYDWTGTSWDLLDTASPTSETGYQDTSTCDYNNFQDNINDLDFHFRIVGSSTTAGFKSIFDQIKVTVTYDNHNELYYDIDYEIDFYFEIDIGVLLDDGKMLSKSDITDTYLTYMQSANISTQDVTYSFWDFDLTQWDSQSSDTVSLYTTFDTEYDDANALDNLKYWSTDAKCRIRLTALYEVDDTQTFSGTRFYYDLVQIDVDYNDHLQQSYDYFHYIDGYVEFDYSSLTGGGNITSRADFQANSLDWIWQTNISNTVDWYLYDWDSTGWDLILDDDTQTTFALDEYVVTNEYIHSTLYTTRLRFVTEYEDLGVAVDSGINIQIDFAEIGTWYENHNTPTYDWYHYIKGEIEIDMSILDTNGNVTSLADFMGTSFQWIWQTNQSNSVSFYAYDFTSVEWDLILTDTQTSFDTDTSQIFDDITRYINSTYVARFRFVTEYLQENETSSDGIRLDLDLVELHLAYENHQIPTYDYYHFIDGYLEIDLSGLQVSGNITSINDFMQTTFQYLWRTNISNPVQFYAYNFDQTQWDIMDEDTQTSFATDTNDTVFDSSNYWDPTNYYARFRFVTEYIDTNVTDPDGIQLEFDLTELGMWYENHKMPVYDYFHYIDGYLQIDMSSLSPQNITNRDAFMQSTFSYNWKTNISSSVSFYAYNFDLTQWDIMDTDTQTGFATDTNDTIFDSTAYIHSTGFYSRFRFTTEYFQENETAPDGIQLEFDLIDLNLWYENLQDPTWDWFSYIDGYVIMDMSGLQSGGQITAVSDFMATNFEWIWQTNVSNSVSFYAYDWTSLEWDLVLTDTQTTFDTDTSQIFDDVTRYINSTYEASFRFVTEYTGNTNSSTPDGIAIELDLVDLNLWYEDHDNPTYDYYHYIDGYLQLDMSSLYGSGNITSRDDFVQSTFNYIWKTNISNPVSFYAYNWDTTNWDIMATDSQTTFAMDTNTTTFDSTAYYDSTNYYARFRFTTDYYQENETSPDGINLEFNMVELNLWYENHLDPTYDFYHEIDGYVEIDISSLQVAGNITSINDIMATSFDWIWQTNISEQVDFYAYNFQETRWDLMLSDTQTTFETDSNDTAFDSTDYWDPTNYYSRFRFVTSTFQDNVSAAENSGIQLELDLVNLNLWYENHDDPTYDWHHYLDGYIEWDLSDLYDNGNITSRNDITDATFKYLWQTNESESVNFYAYDWDDTEWDIMATDTQTSFALDTNETTFDDTRYYNPSTYLTRFRFTTNYIDTNTTINSSILLDFDFVELNITYNNYQESGAGEGYNWFHYIDGYIEWDLSELDTNGNITSRNDFMGSTFQYLWRTNQSNSVAFYAYDWDDTEWDIVANDTQTSFALDTNTTLFDDIRYINPSTYLVRFRFVSYYEIEEAESDGIALELDFVEITFSYENHLLPTYDNYHYLDAYMNIDFADLISSGNMIDEDDIMGSTFEYLWRTNVSNYVQFYAYDWDGADWEIMDNDTQTGFESDINATTFDALKFYNDTTYTARFKYVTQYIETNITSNSSIQIEFDLVKLSIWYEDHLNPTWDWTHSIDGYLDISLSSLVSSGNITSLSDLMGSSFNWRWRTNISEYVQYYAYNFTGSSWSMMLNDTQTSFASDTNTTVFDSLDFYDPTNNLTRFRFVTEFLDGNTTSNTGIKLDLDVVNLDLAYENHQNPTFDYYHYIDGYIEWDLSALETNGNITSRNDITDSYFEYIWATNVSNTVNFFAYDWDDTEWDPVCSDSQTSYNTDTNLTLFDDTRYYHPTTYLVRYKFTTNYIDENTTISSGIQLDLDLMNLSITYQNYQESQWLWNLSAILYWNYTGEFNYNNDWNWIFHTNMSYQYWTDQEIDDLTIEFQINDTDFDLFHDTIYVNPTMITNNTMSKYYLNNSGGECFVMRINASLLGTSEDQFSVILDWAQMGIFYRNYLDESYVDTEIFNRLVYPYSYSLNNITNGYPYGAGTPEDPTIEISYNVTDIYGNTLVNRTIFSGFTDYVELNYTSPQMRTCLISLADQQSNYLEFLNYRVYSNGSALYEPYLYAELNTNWNISVYDRFDSYITSTVYTVQRENNFINLQLTLHSLKIFNQQEKFAYFNLTKDPIGSEYWSEWLAPGEITEFRLIAGDYILNVTEFEDLSTSTDYAYTLSGDDILMVSSSYTLIWLSQVYQMSVFSEFINWTAIAAGNEDVLSELALYEFVNSYRNESLKIYFRDSATNETDFIIIGAGDTLQQIFPASASIDFRMFSITSGEFLCEWKDLPANKTVNLGIYEDEILDFPQQVTRTELLDLLPIAIIIIIVTVSVLRSNKNKVEQKDDIGIEKKKKKSKKDFRSIFAQDSYLD